MSSKIYAIRRTDAPETVRLVRADSKSLALKHVTSVYAIAAASQDELVELLADGVAVETVAEPKVDDDE
jgi:hypothetical protein